jgi:hypothetical protein
MKSGTKNRQMSLAGPSKLQLFGHSVPPISLRHQILLLKFKQTTDIPHLLHPIADPSAYFEFQLTASKVGFALVVPGQ